MQKKYRILLSAASIALIVVSAAGLTFGMLRYTKADKGLKHADSVIAEYTYTVPISSDEVQYSVDTENLVDIAGLQRVNPDVADYLQIPDTAISYPVMHSDEPGYYLTRDFDGTRSVYGSIYVDAACYENGPVTLLHGHNMKNGTMFGSLKRYRDPEYANSHENVRYTTKDGMEIYQVCAVYDGSVRNLDLMKCTIPYTQEEFDQLKTYITENGAIREDFTWDDKLLVLSTCTGSDKNKRLYVMCKKYQEIKGGIADGTKTD